MMSEDTGECVSCDKLSEQVEKLTKELDNVKQVEFPRRVQKVTDALKRKHEKELVALAEQNEKMREALQAMVDEAFVRNCGLKIADDALSLPNLASPVLNRIKAEAYREAAKFCINNPLSDAHCLAEMLRAQADELEQSK